VKLCSSVPDESALEAELGKLCMSLLIPSLQAIGKEGGRELASTCGKTPHLSLRAPVLAGSRQGRKKRCGSLTWPLGLAACGVLS